MKKTNRWISFLLSAVMIVTTFLAVGPVFTIESRAATTIGGITQQRVVDVANEKYKETYEYYRAKFFGGSKTNWPTDYVIPGLSSSDDYTPQGMTYWRAKEWILISAYDAGGSDNSVIYAIDAKSTEFVALYKIYNEDGSVNTSHGGGIAASDYNFYYADSGSNISYWPLSDMDMTGDTDGVKEIYIKDSISCAGELNNAATSYCCYDEGVLWAGNFYWEEDNSDRYEQKAHSNYKSGLMGYRLMGNSSEEEWHYLSSRVALSLFNAGGAQSWSSTQGSMSATTSITTNGSKMNISGTYTNTSTTTISEITSKFATFYLVEGEEYTIEFTSDYASTDMYLFAPNGKHRNMRGTTKDNGNGTYTRKMTFTAGLDEGGDCSWPETLPGDNTYTGTYNIRFDLDSVPANTSKAFNITNFSINKATTASVDSTLEGSNCAGNPTYCIFFADDIDRIQYAMVDSGKIYMSRSWSRNDSGNHIRELDIANLDIHSTGGTNLSVNGYSRDCHVVTLSQLTRFGGAYRDAFGVSAAERDKMLFMGEALCVMDGYLYMFGEGAAWTYNGKDSSDTCDEPIDVIWKIDQYAIMNEERTTEDIPATHYEKVNSLAEITDGDEYIIVFQSAIKDPITQKPLLYAIDSYGNYGDTRLPKNDNPTQANTYDAMGIIGYKIDRYTLENDEKLYLQEEDDANKSIRWKISGANGGNLRIKNMDPYYSTHRNLLVTPRVFSLASDTASDALNKMALTYGDGHFRLTYTDGNAHTLWCNDGTNAGWIQKYSDHYNASGNMVYSELDEIPGTFHSDAYYRSASGGNLTGGAVGIGYQYLDIYKRVPDPEYQKSLDSKVHTDLSVDLQSDGTYNITLETYATASLHYKEITKRPTDFVFVMDKSGSMYQQEGPGYNYSNESLSIGSICDNEDNTAADGVRTVWANGSDEHIRTDSGEYRLIQAVIKTTKHKKILGITSEVSQIYWAYYNDNETYYILYTNGTKSAGMTKAQLETYVNNNQNSTASSNEVANKNRMPTVMYTGAIYRKANSVQLLQQEKNLAVQLTYDIAADAAATGLDHRIALCRVGYKPGDSAANDNTSTAYYKAGSTSPTTLTVTSGFSSNQDFSNVFNTTSQFGTLRTAIDNLVTGGHSHTDYAMYTMIPGMVKASEAAGNDYTYSGNRTLCVIMFTDGGMCSVEDKLADPDNNSGARNVAGSTIMGAKAIKEAGGHIFTVQVGTEDIANWDETLQLECVSSEYVSAKSGTLKGDPSEWKVNFYRKVATSSFNHKTESNAILTQVNEARNYSLAKLDTNAVIRETLNLDTFALDNQLTKISAHTEKAEYDGLGRLSFKTESGSTSVSSNIDTANGSITVWGYDFSTNYVAPANETNARKLVIVITGVLPSDDLLNTEGEGNNFINNTVSVVEKTGVYASQRDMQADDEHMTFPEARIVIPQYNYVLDYGTRMFDPDVDGTVVSLDTEIRRQSPYKPSFETDNCNINWFPGEVGGETVYGLNYAIKPTTKDVQTAYALVKRPNGTDYDWFRLNIIPASTVHFEETWLEKKAGTSGTAWTQTGTSTFTQQSLSGDNDVYGQDAHLTGVTDTYSNNTYKQVTVTPANKQSETLTTKFVGTGIDLYSTCGRNTGVQVVAVRDTSGNLVKSYVVDTFFNGDTFTQVPIVRFTGDYGTYTIETTAAHLSFAGALTFGTESISSEILDKDGIVEYTAQVSDNYEEQILKDLGFEELIGTDVEFVYYSEDSVLNGGEGPFAVDEGSFTTQGVTSLNNYIDGFRTYNPLEADVQKYYIMSEKNPTYFNVLELLASDGTSIGSGATFVEIIEGNTAQGTDYNSPNAPKAEFYLQNDDEGLTFKIPNWIPGATKLMVSARAVKGVPNLQLNEYELGEIKATTDLFYDFSPYVTEGGIVVLRNVAQDTILALNTIKLVDASGGIAPIGFESMSVVNEILAMPVVEGSLIRTELPEEFTNPGTPPEVPDFPENPDNDEPDDGDDDVVPPSDDNEEPAEEGFFAKVESFFVKIFNFFKNIFNKVSAFLKF